MVGYLRFSFAQLRILFLQLLAFLLGVMNLKDLLYLLGVGYISRVLTMFILCLLGVSALYLLKNVLSRHRGHLFSKCFLFFTIVVFVKYLTLYLSSPQTFMGVDNFSIGIDNYSSKTDYLSEALFFLIIILSIFVFVRSIRSLLELQCVVVWLTLGCSIAPLISFVFFPYMVGSREILVQGVTFSGGFWNSSVIAFVAIFWIVLFFLRDLSFMKSLLMKGLLAVILLGSAVGLSRSFFVALTCSSLVYFCSSKSFRNKFAFFFVLLIFAFIGWYFFGDVISNMQFRLQNHKLGDESRLIIWSDYLSHVSEYWLFGSSVQGYRFYSLDGFGPHSIFLNCFVRFGIFGLLAFGVIIYSVFQSITKIARYYSSEKASLLFAWLANYLALVSYNETGFLVPSFYIVLALIIVMGDLVSRQYERG